MGPKFTNIGFGPLKKLMDEILKPQKKPAGFGKSQFISLERKWVMKMMAWFSLKSKYLKLRNSKKQANAKELKVSSNPLLVGPKNPGLIWPRWWVYLDDPPRPEEDLWLCCGLVLMLSPRKGIRRMTCSLSGFTAKLGLVWTIRLTIFLRYTEKKLHTIVFNSAYMSKIWEMAVRRDEKIRFTL